MFWWPVVSGDAYLYIRDLSLFAAPMKHYMMARFAAGGLPMWTPYVSGGMPFLSDPSNQLLYPPNVIYFLFSPVERAMSLSVALHSLLGMCAFAGLCRVLGVSRWIAVWSGHNYAYEPVRHLGLNEDTGVVRIGLAHYNTAAEVERTLGVLGSVIA